MAATQVTTANTNELANGTGQILRLNSSNVDYIPDFNRSSITVEGSTLFFCKIDDTRFIRANDTNDTLQLYALSGNEWEAIGEEYSMAYQ